MPRRDVWIRKDNVEKWDKLPSKSEFVNNAINGELPFGAISIPEPEVVRKISSFTPDTPIIPKTEVKDKQCPRHHVPYSVCKGPH